MATKLIRNGKVLVKTVNNIDTIYFDYGIEAINVTSTDVTIVKGNQIIYKGLLSNLLDINDNPYTASSLATFLGGSQGGGGGASSLQIEVNSLNDLPTPNINNEIIFSERKSYLFGDFDLLGYTIVVTSPNVTISGFSSETSQLTSTGKQANKPLIRFESTCVVRDITFL